MNHGASKVTCKFRHCTATPIHRTVNIDRMHTSAVQLATLSYTKYSRFVRTQFWISDRAMPPGL